ncbi:hypothetical protein HB364_13570 [Pseudoflavitalea sp. X16]|uniref:hypothetical protein n=1 Tax=Paraflavitalea devenefica TaxID=2716334 RepID=UPI0014233299|nr:hypothetical protein [Paraflavitalea devenefica]NII26118.1 hypothetical protein [Paraflavitalea devenefica]
MARPKRDEFAPAIVATLQFRVGTLCSNPKCRVHTTGPHTEPGKVTRIGSAAHITAAATGGPRYDPDMPPAERSSIANGIWLCENCATLIDKDAAAYPVELLKQWKRDAEQEMNQRMISGKAGSQPTPHMDIDLHWKFGGRFIQGYSKKNPTKVIDGRETIELQADGPQIIHWRLSWNYDLCLFNNSLQHMFNVSVEVGKPGFEELSKLEKINNLPPLKGITMSALSIEYMEGTAEEADPLLLHPYPARMEGMTLRISYRDEHQKQYEQNYVLSKGNFQPV